MRYRLWATGLLVMGAMMGCGSESIAPGTDASSGADGGTPSDGGGGSDSGTTDLDAGPPPDSQVPRFDSGPPIDAGMPEDVMGCGSTTLLEVPDDPGARGPWPVGARTVTVGRLTVEVWYPAAPGSDSGVEPVVYDIRNALPASERASIPDSDNPWQPCDCRRDLPIDEAHGPYPVIVFVHGTAGFRTQSLSFMTHWASRGFVVVAADHPGLWMQDLLGRFCGGGSGGSQDLRADVDAMLAAVTAASGDLSFLSGRVDMTRVGLSGHSAGGAVAGMTSAPGVQVVVPMAGSTASMATSSLRSTLVMGGEADTVVRWSQVQMAYSRSATPRRLVGIANAGHLAFSNLCDTVNAEGQDLVEVATEHDVCGVMFASFLFDCNDDYVDPPVARAVADYASTAVFEEVLTCRDRSEAWAQLRTRHPDVATFETE